MTHRNDILRKDTRGVYAAVLKRISSKGYRNVLAFPGWIPSCFHAGGMLMLLIRKAMKQFA